MIYSASSLLLTTLVFNAASVWGAPLPVYTDDSAVVRSSADDVLPRKISTIDVVPHQRSVDPEQVVDARDAASGSSESIEARDPLPEVERIVRRYPRKVYQDFYEKRSPSPSPEAESSPPLARSSEANVERRFPRRALYERHEARSNPAPVEARSDPEPADIQRRYPRKVYADFYEKREPSLPSPVEARTPAPELTDSGRRFPRRVYAEHYEKRQDAANPDPATAATPDTPPADPPAVTPTPVVPTPAQVSASVSVSASTSTATTPLTPNVPLDLNRIVKDLNTPPANGYQPGTTIKETTLLVNKITHISDKGTTEQKPAAQLPPLSPATPSSSAAASSSSAPAAPTSTPAAGDAPVTPPVAAASTPDSTTPPPADGETPPPAAATPDEATPPVTGGDATRRSMGSNQASRQPIIRRQLGYSGPAWASHLKRNVN